MGDLSRHINQKLRFNYIHISYIGTMINGIIFLILFIILFLGILHYPPNIQEHYIDNVSRNVFLYWVGKEYSLISMLRKIIYAYSNKGAGYNVHFITNDNLNQYIPNVPDYFNDLQPAHQADYVRVNVICEYGGIWLDSDTLVLDTLDPLFEVVSKKDGFFIKENNTILSNGVFGSKPRTPLMLEWKQRMIDILQQKGSTISWTEIGNTILENMYNDNSQLYANYTIYQGLDTVYPVNWDVMLQDFIEAPYENYKNIIRPFQPILVLTNLIYKKLEHLSEEEILSANYPLCYFLNLSMKVTT